MVDTSKENISWIEKEWEEQQFLLSNKERSDPPAFAVKQEGELPLMHRESARNEQRKCAWPRQPTDKRGKSKRGKPQKRGGKNSEGIFINDLKKQFKLWLTEEEAQVKDVAAGVQKDIEKAK